MPKPALAPLPALLTAGLLAACTVGPDYHRPDAPVPARFKEAAGWKPAGPREAASGEAWWQVFDDPVLDGLERKIALSNQTLKQSEAAYRQAVALVAEAEASELPTLSVSGSGTRAGSGGGSRTTAASAGFAAGTTSRSLNTYGLSTSASWTPDLWGRIARTIESQTALAQASAADLAAARLSLQATLAIDYLDLRSQDEQKRLLDDTIVAYRKSLDITRNQYKAGVAAQSDVIVAETQLRQAEAEAIGLGVQRAQYEHAIAMLIGQPPDGFSIAPAPLGEAVPVVPTGLPSSLLERRPDIAAAERTMAAANAQVGVAIAAYYPDLTLSASYGVQGSSLGHLLDASNGLWSFGGTLAETVFDAGLRDAQVAAAKAAWDQDLASYRQTVLAAFQGVEDQLAALRILEDQARVQADTVKSANEAARLTLNQYKAGIVAYTAVVTAQATALSAAQTLVTIKQSRLTAAVSLVQDLGGGWSADRLPARDKLAEEAG